MSYEVEREKRSQFLSLTGIEAEVFDELYICYGHLWEKHIREFTIAEAKRNPPHRVRKDGVLDRTEDQLLLLRHYPKSNSIQEYYAAATTCNKASATSGSIYSYDCYS